MDVDTQIESPAKPLDHGHRAPTTIRDAVVVRVSAQETRYGANERRDDAAAQVVIHASLVAQAVRQTQHPLPHRHVGEHVIAQVGGALSHPGVPDARTCARWGGRPAAATTRTHPRLLQGGS
jgi:hypothetical protein